MQDDLNEHDLGILDIENRLWTRPGPKEAAIRAELGISANQYQQQLNRLLDDPRALRHNPVMINRMRRVRAARRAAREARRAS